MFFVMVSARVAGAVEKAEPLLDIPIVIQDGIIVALLVSAVGLLLYRRWKRKPKSCPACEGACPPASKLTATPNSAQS